LFSTARLPSFSFFGGKGGVGKTTCAAIGALDAARRGRTLLVTTDPASSLSAVLDVKVGADPRPVRGAPGLEAANIDAARAFQRWLQPRRDLLEAIAVRGTYLDNEDVARLLKLSLPGIDEIIGLLEIVRLAGSREDYATVIVDTAPTGHTLRLLAAPALLGRVAGVLDLLQSHHRTVVSALRGAYARDASDALIEDLDREGSRLASMLRDPAATELTWITLPEPMALEETSDAIAALAAAGMRVKRLIVNRIAARPAGGCSWCEARRRFESRAIAPVGRRFQGIDLRRLPELSPEPRGAAALRRAGARLTPWKPAASAPRVQTRVRAQLPPHLPVKRELVASALRQSAPTPDLAADARWLLFGGKGGVGKSTCAAAEAVHLSSDRRVLLLSTDPAHSLADVFGAPLDDRPRTIPGASPLLHVREIDAGAEMADFRRRYMDGVDEAFSRIARSTGAGAGSFRELIDLAPPGIDEVIAVAGVAAALAGGNREYDVVVTDTAPTGHALRLLQTPPLLRDWTQALMSMLLKYREVVGAGSLAAMLVQLSRHLRALQAILADADQTRFIVVTRAASLPTSESGELLASLRAMKIAVGAILVNALGAGGCPRCRSARAAESRHLARLRSLGRRGRYAMIGAPAEVPPPHGAPTLLAWRRTWRQIA
jgi:arsenite/tail-anchored protein-transporting ATPase